MNHCVTEFLPLMLIRTAGLPLRWPGCSIDRVEVWMEMYVTALNQLRATQQLASSAFEMEKECLLSDSQLQKTMTNTRRRLRSKMDDSAFPIDSLLREQRPDLSRLLDDLNEKIAHKELVFSQLKGNFAEWVQEERKALIEYASHETIVRSLLFSSHSLLRALPLLQQSNPENWNKNERRTAATLLKYLARASAKTTPLSRWATVNLQYLNRTTNDADEMASVFSTAKHIVTPNVALLPALYDTLLQDPAFFNTLGIRLNPSLQNSAGRYEWLYFNGEQEGFQQVYKSTILEVIQSFFEQGEKNVRFCDLTVALADEMQDQEEDIQSFVFQLIDYGWIEWIWPEKGISAGWCGSLYNYLGFLPSSSLLTDAAYLLQWLRTAARTLSFQSVAEAREVQLQALLQCRTFRSKRTTLSTCLSNMAAFVRISHPSIFFMRT